MGRCPLTQKRRGPSDAQFVPCPDGSAGEDLTAKPALMDQALDQVGDLQPFLQIATRLAEFVAPKPYFSDIEDLPDQIIQLNTLGNQITTKHLVGKLRSSFLIELIYNFAFDQSNLLGGFGIERAVPVSLDTLARDRSYRIYRNRFSTGNQTGTDQLHGGHLFLGSRHDDCATTL